MQNAANPTEISRTVYTVARLNREARFILNECFGSLWVEGEISNFSVPASGHWYFSLKDAEAQVRCAMFRPQNRFLDFKPGNGDRVLVKAQVSLYEPRGEFQLVVETMEPAGDGALLRAFEALKQRLAAEGLFDAGHKRPIPALPHCIGVITSPTGAAVRDILTVLKRRFPAIPVIIFPVKVQGTEASGDIVRALSTADRLELCDVLILARGGGSLEDLWAFNEEAVARALFACRIPLVTGIGHEIDFTIADFVADLRAPTPSAAAEAVSPDGADWLIRFRRLELQLQQRIRDLLERHRRTLSFLGRRLGQVHPDQRLRTQSQRLDELELRLKRIVRSRLDQLESRLHIQCARLNRHHPRQRILLLETRTEQLGRRLTTAMGSALERENRRAAELTHQLNAVSPLATLARGYSITRRSGGLIVRSHKDVQPGDRIETRVTDGVLTSQIVEVGKE